MKNTNKIKDLSGKKFGRLTVLGIADKNSRKTYWVCQCDCGNIKTVRSDSLQIGAIKSCGCLKKEQDSVNLTANHSHKMSGTKLYKTWQGIKKRCNNIRDTSYHNYGGRGIKVCSEWEDDFNSFYTWAIQNGYSENLSIDRIDNNKGYSPDNCRWVDSTTQSNNRRSNIKITIGNSTRSLMEWCTIFDLDYKTMNARYHSNGYSTVDEFFNKG